MLFDKHTLLNWMLLFFKKDVIKYAYSVFITDITTAQLFWFSPSYSKFLLDITEKHQYFCKGRLACSDSMHMLRGRTNWNLQHTTRLCISLCMQKDVLVHVTLILLLILLSTSVHRSGYWHALICESLCKYMQLQWRKSLEDLNKPIYSLQN